MGQIHRVTISGIERARSDAAGDRRSTGGPIRGTGGALPGSQDPVGLWDPAGGSTQSDCDYSVRADTGPGQPGGGLRAGNGGRYVENYRFVFAGGDVASGPATLIEAILAGKQAAVTIDCYLQSLSIEHAKSSLKELESEDYGK